MISDYFPYRGKIITSQSFGTLKPSLLGIVCGFCNNSPSALVRGTCEDVDGCCTLQYKVRQQQQQQVSSQHHLITLFLEDGHGTGGWWCQASRFHQRSLKNSFPWVKCYHGDEDESDTSEHSSGNHVFSLLSNTIFLLSRITLESCNLDSWTQLLRYAQTLVNFWHDFIFQKLYSKRAHWKK